MVKRNTVKSGSVKNLVINNIGPDVDFSKRGSIAKEARRLMVIAKADGLETTEGSINQAIRAHLIKSAKETTELVNAPLEKSRRETVKPLGLSKNDDFDELDKMLVDAVAAMKLIQEHMPKVKKEVEKLRVLREKMLTLLS
jgi:formate dehydrogenase maturation protein FdhE